MRVGQMIISSFDNLVVQLKLPEWDIIRASRLGIILYQELSSSVYYESYESTYM